MVKVLCVLCYCQSDGSQLHKLKLKQKNGKQQTDPKQQTGKSICELESCGKGIQYVNGITVLMRVNGKISYYKQDYLGIMYN